MEQILSHVDKRFEKDNWNIKTLTQKADQKCRDSRVTQPGEATPKGGAAAAGVWSRR